MFDTATLIWLIPLIAWGAFWKAWGLWRAGQNNQLRWFIVIFILNTAGILPIIYLKFFQKSNGKTQILAGEVK